MWPNVMQTQPYANTTNIYNNHFYPQPAPVQPQPMVRTTNIYNNYFMDYQQPYMRQQPMTAPIPQPMMAPISMPIAQPIPQTMPPLGQQMGGFPPIQQGPFGQTIGGGFPQQVNPFIPSGSPGVNTPFIQNTNPNQQLLSLIWGSIMKNAEIIKEKPFSEEIIIEDELKGAWGDPHFNFKDKTGEKVTIDHKGTDGQTYNVLNADGLDIDAEYKKHADTDNPQVMGAVRIDAGGQELVMNKGKVTLDGKEVNADEIKLADGRTATVQENGSVAIKTKDGKGTIKIENDGEYYNIDPSGTVGINSQTQSGGVLGFLTTQGKTKTRDEILKEYDTNKNGMLDDGDKLPDQFRAQKDIGLY